MVYEPPAAKTKLWIQSLMPLCFSQALHTKLIISCKPIKVTKFLSQYSILMAVFFDSLHTKVSTKKGLFQQESNFRQEKSSFCTYIAQTKIW